MAVLWDLVRFVVCDFGVMCVVILAFGVCGSCLLGVWVYVLYEFVWVFGVVTGVWWVLGVVWCMWFPG